MLALRQRSFERLLIFGGIAQVGFLLIGLCSLGTGDGLAAPTAVVSGLVAYTAMMGGAWVGVGAVWGGTQGRGTHGVSQGPPGPRAQWGPW